jgi:cell wall-associated NlpC family hydrolase
VSVGEIDILSRAHALFAGDSHQLSIGFRPGGFEGLTDATGVTATAYRDAAGVRNAELTESRHTDDELSRILSAADHDQRDAYRGTGAVLAAARTDTAVAANPIAEREHLRRSIIRLRTQRHHILAARRQARRRRAALLALRYRMRPVREPRSDSRAQTAVRAALSKLGCPYVWGAGGPDRFDCSGLVKWAYAQAGVRLHRTTYDQIHDGLPIAAAHIRPGDLVFPHAGHVQLAIGNNLVVEAPHAGATVQISRLGTNVSIRRPV